jgi:hypothetical protein
MNRFRPGASSGVAWGRVRAGFAATLAVLALHATPASACPRCFGASDSNSLLAYFATGAVLTVLPLAIIGTVGFVIYRNNKKNSAPDPNVKHHS